MLFEARQNVRLQIAAVYDDNIFLPAFRCAKKLEDPWATYDFANLPLCRAKRYVYSPLTEKWSENNVYIKIHPEVQ